MNPSAPENLALWLIVLPFWAAVVLIARSRGRRMSPGLLILPAFFLLIGFWCNRARAPLGTYAVIGVHLLLLPALWRIAKMRP